MQLNLPGGSPELKQAIERFFRQVLSFPLRLWRVATGDLPTASTDNEGGVVYDTTTSRPAFSDGSAWRSLMVHNAGAALTRTNDTNVTLTLGGTPATALLEATSLTLGWQGTLAVSRGGTGGGAASGTLLDNISGFSTTGLITRTGSGAYSARTITGTSNQVTVANGAGGSGNPTLSLPATILNANSTYSGSTAYYGTRGDATERIRLGHYDSSTVSFPAGLVPAQILAGVTRLDIATRDNAAGAIVFRAGSGVAEIAEINSGGLDLRSGKTLEVNSVQVVAARQTGWGAATGTATRTAIATYTAPTISNPPTQAEVQAIADALQAWSRRAKAMGDDIATHGLIGA